MAETGHSHHTVELTSPAWRVGAAALVIGALFLLAYGLRELGVAEIFATVAVVGGAHVATALLHRRSVVPAQDADIEPDDTPTSAVARTASQVGESAGRVYSTLLQEYPAIAPWLGRGSLAMEILKGILAGCTAAAVQLLVAGSAPTAWQSKEVGFMGISVPLPDFLGVAVSVAGLAFVTAWVNRRARRDAELNAVVRAIVVEFKLLDRILTPQALGVEALKAVMKGLLFSLLRIPVLGAMVILTNPWLLGSLAAILAAAIIMPGATKGVAGALTRTKPAPTE